MRSHRKLATYKSGYIAHISAALRQSLYFNMTFSTYTPGPSNAALLFVILIGSWSFFQGVYSRWFHPLAHIPGPFFCSISVWPSAYHARKRDRHLWIEACFNKYGNKIRIAPNEVLFRNPAAHRDIYGSRANVRRADFYNALLLKESLANTFSHTDNAAHTRSRKLLDLAFSNKSIRAASVFMQQHIDRWHELLIQHSGEDWTEPRNLTNWANYLVLDILGDVCYGKSLSMMEPGENPFRAMPQAITAVMASINFLAKTPFLHALILLRSWGLLEKIMVAIRPKQGKLFDEFAITNMEERLAREKQGGATREDMIHFLYTAKDPETGERAFNDDQLQGESRLLLIAGSDSTSVTMSGMIFYLSHYPQVLDKLRDEVCSTFTSADDIAPGPQLSSCKYVRACIDEAMRMSPAGLSELPRQVLPGGTTIDDEFFPAGTIVGTAIWADGRNPEIYGDTEIYRPERWIVSDDNPAESVLRIKSNFHPFSIGPHNCAGTTFALQQLMLVAAKTVHRLEFRLAPQWAKGEGMRHRRMVDGKEVPHFQLADAFITARDGPMVQFRKRRVGADTAVPHVGHT